jgi:nucleotide-binding universal stress UspA family protein
MTKEAPVSTTSNPAAGKQPASDGQARATLSRIAVGVDGYPEGLDAVVLGQAIAQALGADLLLVSVHTDPIIVVPAEMSWKALERQAQKMLWRARDELAPGTRVDVETDLFIPRALERVVRREHRDLLVLGSSRHVDEGRVRIGKRTRQLLTECECAIAIAPRGMHSEPEHRFARIGVGYDGGPEAQAGLELAATIAAAAGAELHVRAVVDDRIRSLGASRLGTGPVIVPGIGWSAIGSGGVTPGWDEVVQTAVDALGAKVADAARGTAETVETDVQRGRPADALLELSEEVDLLLIGSRRWGPFARVILGTTGEALLHDASCPVLVVPRPKH